MDMKQKASLVIQFAKWPRRGSVKTRLIPSLGRVGACQAHVELAETVLLRLAKLPQRPWDYAIAWDRPPGPATVDAAPLLRQVQRLGIGVLVQRGADLGKRMLNALADGLETYESVVIVGSDCPVVESTYVAQALASLERQDVVLGPAEDGGYVLIGARRTQPSMLDGVTWGSSSALRQTCEALSRNGLSFTLLRSRWDVDTANDWQRFLAWKNGGPVIPARETGP
ncbi:TIGR04282 family arsenosugar biosynthesis glycosyltransferase [Mangrovitalea sediminis]|uniref:TIGR04282 family arsenosugar biosynthesis glycosyltransferase n=1 Tax=Mangrovitalea sediminis TaxID=1982043 RepID=UPI000BE58774|nr:TIGR04282 family arsenosugar biosynthesis glycosyltransferase [Mangrovitalea sediminis]